MARQLSRRKTTRRQEITIGVLVAVDASVGYVDFPDNASGQPVPARSTVPLETSDAGREVAMMFEFGDTARPLIIGLIQQARGSRRTEVSDEETGSGVRHLRADRIVLEAGKELVLKTKQAKLVLRENGDIEVHGVRIVSRARTLQKLLAPMLKLN